jgi:hypothetical protein
VKKKLAPILFLFLLFSALFSLFKFSYQKRLTLAQNQIDLSAQKTVATSVYRKYAFPIETPSHFNFIGLSGNVAVESTEAQTLYAALFSIQNVPSGNCPPPGTVWNSYSEMGNQYPGVHSISAFIVRDIGSGRKEVPTEFTLPIKVPITGCIFVVLDGADIKQAKQITMESNMKMIYDTGPAPSPAPYFIQLDHEFCYGLNFPPICTMEGPSADKAFAKTIKVNSPLYLWSLSGDVSASTFVPPWTGAPSGPWTTEFDYYLYENCPPPPLGNSGPSDHYSQIPNNAENLLSLSFQGNGQGVFNQPVLKTFGPKLINPGNCLVALTRSIAGNAGLDNESQVYALVQPVPASTPTPTPTPCPKPTAPSNITCSPNCDEGLLFEWQDNSHNENGFKIVKDYFFNVIGDVGPNTTSWQYDWCEDHNNHTYNIYPCNQCGDNMSASGVVCACPTCPPSPTPTPIPEDLNQDGVVDSQDINILLQNWGHFFLSAPAADLNADDLVNTVDFGIMLRLI